MLDSGFNTSTQHRQVVSIPWYFSMKNHSLALRAYICCLRVSQSTAKTRLLHEFPMPCSQIFIRTFFWLLLVVVCPILLTAQDESEPGGMLSDLFDKIQRLESQCDPKCAATASRLEDFMYGTPLTDDARFKKIDLQKRLILDLWREASLKASEGELKQISAEILVPVLQKRLEYAQLDNGDWKIKLDDESLTITGRDKRQYSSIAYALRAILAVQQDLLASSDQQLTPLADDAIDELQNFLDLYTLSVLQLADSEARLTNERTLSEENFVVRWNSINESGSPYLQPTETTNKATEFPILKKIIEQKVASYKAYNQITNQIFMRNLQVYFAKSKWPSDPDVGTKFKKIFTEAMILYAHDLLKGAEKTALQDKESLIRVAHVKQFADKFIPHRINEYEDAIFFHHLAKKDRITVESYDMDSFRDSGIHWQYLQYVIENPEYDGVLEPDPFAAELLVENIAQFGVLLLRATGMVANEEAAERLHPDQIEKAFQLIQSRINAHNSTDPDVTNESSLTSSTDQPTGQQTYFTDISQSAGIDFTHRTSDWLNRLIRSYALKSDNVGQLNIPPAFGGSGVAAEDVNNDGHPDILLLSGLGNKLYLNNGKQQFVDVTVGSGLDWRRADGRPGEPRQPIIADFDNDGWQDILITYVDDTHRLYRNLGNGRFEDVSRKAGLGGRNLVGGPAVVFDYDNDGLLDIYILYFGDYIHGVLPTLARRNSNGLPNKLFRNVGDFQFKNVTEGSGLANTGWGQAASHTDLDRDGWQDLIVGNDFGVNAYYRNKGDGTFENIADKIGTGKPSYTMSVGIGDLNQDLIPDIYISNIVTMNKDEKYVAPSEDTPMEFDADKLANMRVVEANDLFVSKTVEGGLPEFQLSKKVDRGYSSTGWAWGADFFDVDNDGDDDLYVANGMNDYNLYGTVNAQYVDPSGNENQEILFPESGPARNVFFVNSKGRLQNVSKLSGADLLGNSRSVAYLDYDQDGDLDMILNNFNQTANLYRNNADQLGTNWLKVKLIGDPAKNINRDAIGARIIVTTDSGMQIWREVHGGVGYLSMHPKEQHFGLGKQSKVNILVEWPNGDTTRFKGVSANKRYTILPTDNSDNKDDK